MDADDGAVTVERLSKDGEVVPTRSSFTEALSLAGQACGRGWAYSGALSKNLAAMSRELGKLEDLRDSEEDPGARHSLTVQYRKALRAFKRERASHECSAAIAKLCSPSPFKKCAAVSGRVYALRDADNHALCFDTPEAIGVHAFQTDSRLFQDPSGEPLPSWIYKRWSWNDLECLRRIDESFLKEIVLGMAPGRTSAEDLIVAEMLQHLDDDVLEALAHIMALRFISHHSEDSEGAWNEQVLNLIKKTPTV